MPDEQLLEQVDFVLNACGRPQTPDGTRFAELPYFISFHSSAFAAAAPGAPTQGRIANNRNYPFAVKGINFQNYIPTRIKWPSGKYLAQGPGASTSLEQPGAPLAVLALNRDVVLDPGARASIEMTGADTGLVDLIFMGVLRIPIKGNSMNASSSIIDPIAELEARPRFLCGPPQNIMAPEWALGNQCGEETPAGYEDESFTFFSPDVTVTIGSQVFDTVVQVPGGGDDVIIKRCRALSDYSNVTGGPPLPTFGLRLPNGYSITGGDLIPSPVLEYWPWVPSVRIRNNERLILDVADMVATGATGSITSKLEFDAVRRKGL